ncbi:ABC transporter permease [Agaricicola taiwanensis]|uniref:ABC transporter permease n=1 Tax=Agaricicola taiwanensis TaxID=591372 RepID=A0A8J2VNW6_9RHOB|nr:ABC transporter permease [Agaricicola taiwanensis]GGE31868.1 ABC transporter permease [Agaricicola taiwanensis]
MSFLRVSPWSALKIAVGAVYAFMLTPILITAVVSLNATNRSLFPPQGLSLRWWGEAFSPEWVDPLIFSLKLSAVSAVLSPLMALPLTFALVRYTFPGRQALMALTLGPLLLPALVTGVALLQFFDFMGWRAWIGFPALVAGHVAICLPFAVRTIAISLTTLPPNLELAAASLGASKLRTLMEITLPYIKNGIVAGGVFAFIHSFTDINLSLFLVRPGEQPITVKIMGFLEYGFAPTLAAVSVITLVLPLILVLIVERLTGLGNFIYGGRGNG